MEQPTVKILDKTFELYLTQIQIEERIQTLAQEVTQFYADKDLVIIGVLNGAFRFVGQLAQYLPQNEAVIFDFVKINSYQDMKSTGKIHQAFYLKQPLTNKYVLLVEDIVDTGFTVDYILEKFEAQKPLSVNVATLLFKPSSLKTGNKPHFVGFEIPSLFVVGYGLDYNEKGRNLNHIYTLKED